MNRSFIVRITISRGLKRTIVVLQTSKLPRPAVVYCFRWGKGDKLSDSVLSYNSLG